MAGHDDFRERHGSSYHDRLDLEWLTLNAVRELFSIGVKGKGEVTYGNALLLGRDIAPPLFDPDGSLIIASQEPPLLKFYRERSEALSEINSSPVSPVELIDRDIQENERLLDTRGAREMIREKLRELRTIREQAVERSYSENSLIIRDVFSAERLHLPSSPINTDRYVEYRLPFDRAMRIRILHPDHAEHVTGADLIYEFCQQEDELVRVAFLQYKLWDGQTLYFSQARNLEDQLLKLQKVTCEGGICACKDPQFPPKAYRLPFCAAFLRPTDRLQSANAKLMSSGLHIPVCVALTVPISHMGGRILRNDPIRSRAISHRLFEELFNRNMLGSRWLTYKELETLYKRHDILGQLDSIVVHAQEFKLQ